MKINEIIQGDSLAVLKTLPDESVDMIITSPPYYGLRRYGDYEQQIGLEKTFDEYKTKILEITAELKRVLKKSGQLYWNMGDIYGTGSGAGSRQGTKQATNKGSNYYDDNGKNAPGEQKCLMMMPERIALEMIDEQGWILRNKIKWVKQVLLKKENITKGSVMPTSVKDRFNESGEELYFFVKNKKYYSNLDAVRLPQSGEYEYFNRRVRDAQKGIGPQFKASEEEIKNYAPADHRGKNDITKKNYGLRTGRKANNPELGNRNFMPIKNPGERNAHLGMKSAPQPNEPNAFNIAGKNLPTIWLIGSEPHNFQKELDGIDIDHFAIFPQALLEIPIKFGCPPGGIILDPFMGSGQTAIMAKKLDRNFIGIELSKEYIKIAEERIKNMHPTLF